MDLAIYFTVNLAFVNYFANFVECLDVPILKKMDNSGTNFAHFFIETFQINSSLLQAPKILKDFVHQYKHKTKFLICKKDM